MTGIKMAPDAALSRRDDRRRASGPGQRAVVPPRGSYNSTQRQHIQQEACARARQQPAQVMRSRSSVQAPSRPALSARSLSAHSRSPS